MAGGGHGTKAVIAALLANLGIAVAKFVGFVITGSASMLAESIHSVADSGNQGLLLLGGHRARREADEAHPFGYGRERYFWAFVVALVLFSLGGAFAIFEGIEKIRHPHELESPAVAIGILLFAIVLETFSFRTAIVESNKVRGDAGWWQFIRRSKNPELPVVLLEDLGAVIGLVIALVGRHGLARHRRPDLRRHRHAVDRHAAHRHRHRPRHRDEEPPHRRDGRPRGAGGDPRGASRASRRSSGSSTCAPSTSAPTSCSIGAKVELRRRALRVAELAGGGEPRRGDRARRGARGPGDVHRARRGRHGLPATVRPAAEPPDAMTRPARRGSSRRSAS